MLSRRVFIVGGHITPFIGKGSKLFIDKKHPDFGKKENPNLEHYVNASVQGALANTNVAPELLDKAIIGNFASELFSNQGT